MSMTMAEYLIQKGKAQGKAEGKAQGKAEAKAEYVLRVLRRRFGAVPRPLRTRIAGTEDLATLDRFLDLAVAASTLKESPPRACPPLPLQAADFRPGLLLPSDLT